MVATNKNLGAIEVVENIKLFPRERDIPQVIDLVFGTNHAVPVLDKRIVHLVSIGERSVAILNDVRVTEVGVANKEGLNHDFSRSRSVLLGTRGRSF